MLCTINHFQEYRQSLFLLPAVPINRQISTAFAGLIPLGHHRLQEVLFSRLAQYLVNRWRPPFRPRMSKLPINGRIDSATSSVRFLSTGDQCGLDVAEFSDARLPKSEIEPVIQSV